MFLSFTTVVHNLFLTADQLGGWCLCVGRGAPLQQAQVGGPVLSRPQPNTGPQIGGLGTSDLVGVIPIQKLSFMVQWSDSSTANKTLLVTCIQFQQIQLSTLLRFIN